MTIIYSYPPNYSLLKRHLPNVEEMFFVFGSTIYNPRMLKTDPSLMRRAEKYEELQAEYGTERIWFNILKPRYRISRWWDRYCKDLAFRLSQEIPAHQVQLWEIEKVVKSKKKREEIILLFARYLSSIGNGKLISVREAKKVLETERLVQFRV